jgi:fumarate hydratase subunit alpha
MLANFLSRCANIISNEDDVPSMFNAELVEESVVRLMRTAVTSLPEDVIGALHRALDEETEEIAKVQLRTILDNIQLAERKGIPMCQDTGVPIFFVSGPMLPGIDEAIIRGVARATKEVPLRPNVVDPLTRHNTGDNTGPGMPSIHYDRNDDEELQITYLPKGAGSENMSVLRMLNPSQGIKGIREAVLEAVVTAEGRPCPPTVVGIGIGGTADVAALLSKKALLRPLGRRHPDEQVAALEVDLKELLNRTGIGPMGLGGRATVLDVLIEKASCHTASLPIAINLQCWAARRATVRIRPDGRAQFRTEGFW